jgi:hypothetical protein
METNGHASTPFTQVENELRNIQALAGAADEHHTELPQSVGIVPVEPAQHQDEMHDLMHNTVDKICEEWIVELQQVRANSERVEQLVLEQAAKVKGEISQLFVLKEIAAEHARHGDEVNQKLLRELATLQERH